MDVTGAGPDETAEIPATPLDGAALVDVSSSQSSDSDAEVEGAGGIVEVEVTRAIQVDVAAAQLSVVTHVVDVQTPVGAFRLYPRISVGGGNARSSLSASTSSRSTHVSHARRAMPGQSHCEMVDAEAVSKASRRARCGAPLQHSISFKITF